ncbi:extracellular solute-binding protein [Microlunatus elymi]|uniref:Extracellular solute-binding protein n=1 Tax=Microlunatus elymi TaxID=2596828 RepID=A0A516PX08_9ACTN|nr:extracellular solute-binding protein [Microlunatus elymi]QDP95719.1 extracellular solute-binding protein [Microlunatus elymi]
MIKKKLIKLAAVGIAAVTALVATGCSGLSSSYSTDPTAITYFTWEDTTTNAALDEAFSGWSDGQYHVQRMNIPSAAYNQKLTSLTLAQKLPDFFWCNLDTAEAMGRQGLLYNWADYAKKKSGSFDPAKFSPATLDSWYISPGQLYGLPTLANTYGFFYNKKYLAKAGVSIPKTKWTWPELFSVIKKLKGVNGSKYGLWTMDAPSGLYSLNGTNLLSVGNGGKKVNDHYTGGTELQYDQQLIDAADQWSKLMQAGDVMATDQANANATAAFSSGKTGLLYGGQWLAVSFLASTSMKAGDWGFAPMPTAATPVQPLDPQGVCSPKQLKDPDAVWKALSYLETDVLPKVLAKAPVAPPAYAPSAPPYYDSLTKSGAGSTADTVRYEMQTPTKIPVRFIAPWSQRVGDITNVQWVDIINGKTSAAQGVPKMFADMNQTIKDTGNIS